MFNLHFLVIQNILVFFYYSYYISKGLINLYNLKNFYLLTQNQYFQHKSIHILSHRLLVFRKYLFCFLWIFGFLFYSKIVKVGDIIRCTPIITIQIKRHPMSSHRFLLIKIFCICPIFFILRELFLELIPLHLGSFWYYVCILKLSKGWCNTKNPDQP